MPLCLLERKPHWLVLFYMPFWLGLYFSQFTESVRQIPSSAAELCKAVSYLVSSMPGCLHILITFNGFRCPSDTSLFTCTRRSLDWVYSAQEAGWFSPSAGRPTGCRPLCSPALPPVQAWQYTVCRMGLLLAALPRDKQSMGAVPHLLAPPSWVLWLSMQALFTLIGLHQRRPGKFMAPVPQWDYPMVNP